MKRLLPILAGVAVVLLSFKEVRTAEPEKDQLCLLGTGHSHSPVSGKCSDAYGSKNYETARREWETLAEDGNSSAEFNLGQMYLRGLGVPVDYKRAMKWYKLSAEQAFAPAQSNLGFMYGKGKGVPQNYGIAVEWYKLSAKQGFAPAQYNLGVMYAKGNGVPQNYKTAVNWLNLSANQGYADAQKYVERKSEMTVV